MSYLFTSERLGFRSWLKADVPAMSMISSNKEVMRYFPAPATYEQTEAFLLKMMKMQEDRGYCYFAVELLETKELIGFIGLCWQENELDFSPYLDIGWRLSPNSWRNGYATEGAKACLTFADETLPNQQILATAPQVNKASISVMEKIGMKFIETFKHPKLKDHPDLEVCVKYVYET